MKVVASRSAVFSGASLGWNDFAGSHIDTNKLYRKNGVKSCNQAKGCPTSQCDKISQKFADSFVFSSSLNLFNVCILSFCSMNFLPNLKLL